MMEVDMPVSRFAKVLGLAILVGLVAFAIRCGSYTEDGNTQLLSGQPTTLPNLVLLEGNPVSDYTNVVLRSPKGARRLLGRIPHVVGSARRGAVLGHGPSPAVVAVVSETRSRTGLYQGALFLVRDGQAVRLVGQVLTGSSPLITARGTILVSRGTDGAEPPLGDRLSPVVRADLLEIAAVEPETGQVRQVWSGEGQLAFLATSLAGDEVLLYHVAADGARLHVLDAASGAVRDISGPVPALARDFSFSRATDEVVFARATRPGSGEYDIAAISLVSRPVERVLFRGASDHLMPRALGDGSIAFSLPGDKGLAILRPGVESPEAIAPFGKGSDAVVAESADGRWLVIRHTDSARQVIALVDRTTSQPVWMSHAGIYSVFAGFAGEETP